MAEGIKKTDPRKPHQPSPIPKKGPPKSGRTPTFLTRGPLKICPGPSNLVKMTPKSMKIDENDTKIHENLAKPVPKCVENAISHAPDLNQGILMILTPTSIGKS